MRLVATGIVRHFGRTRVLDGIDLSLDGGDRVAILGDNGAGKTTLLRVLAGLLRPAKGEVRIGEKPPHDPAARRSLGVVGHLPFLYARLSASENLRLWGRLFDVADARARAAQLLAALGLDPDDRRPVAAYSQGMRQRTGLARALLHAPEILLLDEPFAGLDDAGADAAAALIAREGRTVLIASHRPGQATALAARTLRLRDGKLA